ncbi:MAG TPA: acryloyl-CoA reductase [Actinomycetes bacterium]|nr:acryloyl-CoA reductase [Actinomycetes bacterium]
MGRFRAFVADRREATGEGAAASVERGVRDLGDDELPDGEVTVRVAWSSVNYKDALATVPDGRVARVSPLVPGIDLAGEVTASDAPGFQVGDRVLAHGYDLGVSHHGGFAELARVPAGWVVPLPAGLDLRQAMALGTAGYTAALAVAQLEEHGLAPGRGPVLVTGASGGLGSLAVAILAGRGHQVVASTGRPQERGWLERLGAAEVIGREETSAEGGRPLEHARWAGAVDAVGGATLAYVLRTLRRAAAVAACGNTGGGRVETTVFPFILRGVAVLGVDSGFTPIQRRRELWRRLAGDLRPPALEELVTREVTLDRLEPVLDAILAGQVRGRCVVRVGGGR